MNDPDNYAEELNIAHDNKREAFASRAKSPLRPFNEAIKSKPKIDMSLKSKAPLKTGEILWNQVLKSYMIL